MIRVIVSDCLRLTHDEGRHSILPRLEMPRVLALAISRQSQSSQERLRATWQGIRQKQATWYTGDMFTINNSRQHVASRPYGTQAMCLAGKTVVTDGI